MYSNVRREEMKSQFFCSKSGTGEETATLKYPEPWHPGDHCFFSSRCDRLVPLGEMSTILKWFGREDKEKEEDRKEKEEKEKEKTEGEKEKEKQKRRKKEEEKQGDGEEDRSSSSSDSDSEEDQGIAKDDEKEDKD
ncbi:glutamic acid-rich protein-like [Ammospiza nelsoni]|nr:glutamic acid-rich protein-like [Ammospiza nelsoni]